MSFECSAWNNGKHHETGAGYGLKISISGRDRYFKKEWKSVTFKLPGVSGFTEVALNIDKPSFWNKTCHEVINKEIGVWLRSNNLAPWPSGRPPRFLAEPSGAQSFILQRADA